MKKTVSLLLVVVFVLAFSSVAFAFGGTNGDAWTDTSSIHNPEHYTHNVVGELRFDQTTGRKAIPGNAYLNANENSAFVLGRGYSLLDPHDTLLR